MPAADRFRTRILLNWQIQSQKSLNPKNHGLFLPTMKTITPLRIALIFVLVKIVLHLCTAQNLGFHRDEFLYMALGRHLDWGYWSNPPLMGWLSWFSQHVIGESLLATRVLPALAGAALFWVTALMIGALGGGRFAQLLCGIAMLVSIAWLRAFSMFMPVPFEILCWTVLSWLLIRWLNEWDIRLWYWMGLVAGIGFLDKYSVLLWVACLVPALLLTPRRKIFATPAPWVGAGIALVIALPNLFWQWQHGFPVVHHMHELAVTQLSHVKPVNFLIDQVLMNGVGVVLWLAGALSLLWAPSMRPYRSVGFLFVAVLALLLLLSGKSYYTLGVYPALYAAGAVYWEKKLKSTWERVSLSAVVALLAIPLLPTGIPLFPADKLVGYFSWLSKDIGIEGPLRWEQGNLEALPQDYADMLGWDELAALARKAVAEAGNSKWVIYAENYGEAGAVEQLAPLRKPGVMSFADSWWLWAPDTLPPGTDTFIYINHELGADVQNLFADIRKIGEITNPLARERGCAVYLCKQPRADFPAFWAQRVTMVRAGGK